MKLLKQTLILFGLLTLLISAMTPLVISDGCHFSDVYYHLYEPYQKAVINWDGTTETMILASAGKSENLTDMAWVVPIISTTKPNVTAGNMSLFEELVNYFDETIGRGHEGWIVHIGSDSNGNVTVVEIKEVDIYDIVILQATDVSDLLNWLTDNGFKVPAEAGNILDPYVQTENCYFVINKIDLKNKHSDVVNKIESGVIQADFNDHYGIVSYLYYSLERIKKFHAMQILCNQEFYSYYPYNSSYLLQFGFTQEEYNSLVQQFSIDNITFISSMTFNKIMQTDIDELLPDETTKKLYNEIYEILGNKLDPLHEFYTTIIELKQGMATPLKFEFTPPEPYYPLVVSSLNAGRGIIEVYVIADHPVIDRNNVMTIDKCKIVDDNLLVILSEYFSTESASYVTRLTYNGMLSDLQDDAVFEFFPISSPEQPVSTEVTNNIQVLISTHHIWGLSTFENGEILEVQYKIQEDDPWQIIEGNSLWSLKLDTLGLQNGKHTLYVRFLTQDRYDEVSYTETMPINTYILHGAAVEEEVLNEYNMNLNLILLVGISIASVVCLSILVRRKETSQ